MILSELQTGSKAVIAKVNGHGSFRKRLIEMGFIAGKTVTVILNAPLKDPIEYEILGYKLSLRREEASMIEVVSEKEALEHIAVEHAQERLESDEEQLIKREMGELAAEKSHEIRVALVGNPNCGKTSLFNIASGSHEHVGNYSGVTVDAKEGRFSYGGYKFVLVDLPGTYSLSAYSPEELYVRKNLIENVPDVVINVVDASNIERNLYLTTQVIDMNLRTVMALNMYDELEAKGDEVDIKQLGWLLGIPICPTVSRDGRGVNELFDTVIKIYTQSDPQLARHIHINHGPELEKSIDRIKLLIQENRDIRSHYSTRYLSIKYLENDSDIEKVISTLPNKNAIASARKEEQERIESLLHTNTESAIVDAKYAFIQGALSETYRQHAENRSKRTITDKIDAIVTNKWLAFPIFIVLLYIMFKATFSLGNYPMEWIDWLVGKFGDFVSTFMVDGWLKDLVVNGIIAGVGSVLVFLPNILILYFFISIMEDSGYMARAAFIVDKLMHRIGLHGKSFIPMVMGFGCNVPAIMATRTIESRKSRLITIAIIPFMSCAGRLPIFILLAGAFFPKHAALALLGIYVLGVVLAILSALVLSKFVKDDDLPFVMELPPYRIPTAKAIWRHTWEKGRQYLQKMATTILICSIVIWFLGYFPRSQKLIDAQNLYADSYSGMVSGNPEEIAEKEALELQINDLYEEQQADSYIGKLGQAVAPVLNPLGFTWKMDVSLLTGVAAKELVVSTLGVMYSQGAKISEGEDLSEDTALQAALSQAIQWPAALAFMVFILLYFPCIATFVAIKNETGKWKWAIACITYTMVVAWICAFITFKIGMLFL
ncbi:MAG: ferrous iron transport protein B [Bacteroidales bacterium]|nr:ferrous iron transport protein B [Bacteroidales bacterium]MBQ9713253.1 ferrous iron transport protein B [Bacteroidales bacterium]